MILPPLHVQQEIADRLDQVTAQADAMLANARRAVELAKQLRYARLAEVFGPPSEVHRRLNPVRGLGGLIELRGGGPADFYVQRSGTPENVGRPFREAFQPPGEQRVGPGDPRHHIGVTVLDPERLDPRFLFYVAEYAWRTQIYRRLCHGTLTLQHLRLQDVACGLGTVLQLPRQRNPSSDLLRELEAAVQAVNEQLLDPARWETALGLARRIGAEVVVIFTVTDTLRYQGELVSEALIDEMALTDVVPYTSSRTGARWALKLEDLEHGTLIRSWPVGEGYYMTYTDVDLRKALHPSVTTPDGESSVSTVLVTYRFPRVKNPQDRSRRGLERAWEQGQRTQAAAQAYLQSLRRSDPNTERYLYRLDALWDEDWDQPPAKLLELLWRVASDLKGSFFDPERPDASWGEPRVLFLRSQKTELPSEWVFYEAYIHETPGSETRSRAPVRSLHIRKGRLLGTPEEPLDVIFGETRYHVDFRWSRQLHEHSLEVVAPPGLVLLYVAARGGPTVPATWKKNPPPRRERGRRPDVHQQLDDALAAVNADPLNKTLWYQAVMASRRAGVPLWLSVIWDEESWFGQTYPGGSVEVVRIDDIWVNPMGHWGLQGEGRAETPDAEPYPVGWHASMIKDWIDPPPLIGQPDRKGAKLVVTAGQRPSSEGRFVPCPGCGKQLAPSKLTHGRRMCTLCSASYWENPRV